MMTTRSRMNRSNTVVVVLVCVCFLALVSVATGDDQDDQLKRGAASNERNLGEKALRSGNLKQALQHYDKSIQLNPKDAQSYYQRASAYMIDRKYVQAESDLNKALDIDPNYSQALKKRARMFSGQGRFESALNDLTSVVKKGKADGETNGQIQKIQQAQHAAEIAKQLMKDGRQWDRAQDHLNAAIEVAADSVDLLLMRAECRRHLGDWDGVLLDSGQALKVAPGNMAALLLRGKTYYYMNDFDLATRHFREGLRYDQDHKELRTMMRLMKTLTAHQTAADKFWQQRNWKMALEEYKKGSEADSSNIPYTAKMLLGVCRSLVKLKKGKEAIQACSRHIDLLPEEKSDRNDRAQAFAERGEANILLEDYEEGVRDYERAKNLKQDDRAIHEGLENAKKRLKMSKSKDYYKILGIPRDANDKQIRKAYKKLAIQHHPDKVSPDQKEEAIKKFRDIAEAHEILSDPEKRARFDNGEEVEQPQGGGGDPFGGFQNFHFNFGGGGFRFP